MEMESDPTKQIVTSTNIFLLPPFGQSIAPLCMIHIQKWEVVHSENCYCQLDRVWARRREVGKAGQPLKQRYHKPQLALHPTHWEYPKSHEPLPLNIRSSSG